MKRGWLWLIVAVVALPLLGLAVAASGVVPVSASGGHWAITNWLLEFAMSRSVDTHSRGIEPPPLDDRGLVIHGAVRYDIGCAPCHGRPGLEHPRIAQVLLPRPPYLPEVIHQWETRELFYITKHGVKFTGMPAWPTQVRDDEVWAMVAFLERFPELDEHEYRRLAAVVSPTASGEPGTLEQIAGALVKQAGLLATCVRCHGHDGLGRGHDTFPILAGQSTEYLVSALEAYQAGKRPSGTMEPIVAGLSQDVLRGLAEHYANRAPGPAVPPMPGDEQFERGRTIATSGIPAQRVAACVECHGPADHAQHPGYPHLAGQPMSYLITQLELFKSGVRGGGASAHLMLDVAPRLKQSQIEDVARFYASLAPEDAP